MKKLIFTLVFSFAFLNSIEANVAAIDNPIILTEKNDNPISGYEGSNKSSTFLYLYQSDNVFYYDLSYNGYLKYSLNGYDL